LSPRRGFYRGNRIIYLFKFFESCSRHGMIYALAVDLRTGRFVAFSPPC
jgi:hypothetical protein